MVPREVQQSVGERSVGLKKGPWIQDWWHHTPPDFRSQPMCHHGPGPVELPGFPWLLVRLSMSHGYNGYYLGIPATLPVGCGFFNTRYPVLKWQVRQLFCFCYIQVPIIWCQVAARSSNVVISLSASTHGANWEDTRKWAKLRGASNLMNI